MHRSPVGDRIQPYAAESVMQGKGARLLGEPFPELAPRAGSEADGVMQIVTGQICLWEKRTK